MSVEYDKLINKSERETDTVSDKYRENMYKTIESGKLDPSFSDTIDNINNGDYWVISLINNIFQVYIPEKMKEQYLNKFQSEGVKIIKYDGKTLIIEYDGKQISVGSLYLTSEVFNKKDYKSNPNHYSKDVYIPILINKLKKMKEPSKIVIGYINEEVLGAKKLFAWIEITKKEKSYILDFVNNIIVDKDSFYMFYKPEVLNEIDKDKIISDEMLSILINDLNVRYDEYLIFNEEFNNEVENKKGTILNEMHPLE